MRSRDNNQPGIERVAPADEIGLDPLLLRAMACVPWLLLAVFAVGLLIPDIEKQTYWLLRENHPIELLTFAFLMFGTMRGLSLAWRLKKTGERAWVWCFYAFFAVGLFLVGMEEVAWGQWLLGFETPASWKEWNVQGETTLHNYHGFQDKADLLRFGFGIGGCIGVFIGRWPGFTKVAVPSALLPLFGLILVHGTVDCITDFAFSSEQFGSYWNALSEYVEMVIGLGGFLYVALNARRLDAKWSERTADIVLAICLAVTLGLASWNMARLLGKSMVEKQSTNRWFGADIPQVFESMTWQGGNHELTRVHPLFPMVAYPPVYALKQCGAGSLRAARIEVACVAGLWLGAVFVLLRILGCRRIDAVLFSGVAASSAAAVFWVGVPVTYVWGSLAILATLGVVAWADHRPPSTTRLVVANVATLGTMVSNWMVGLIATRVCRDWKRTIAVGAYTLAAVTLLWAAQKLFFPTAEFFLGSRKELATAMVRGPNHPGEVVGSMMFHTMVMPTLTMVEKVDPPPRRVLLSVQRAWPGSATAWGLGSAVLWAGLLGLGLWSLATLRTHRGLRWTVGVALGGQLLLHVFWGEETFVYAMHFLPLWIVVVALTTQTSRRRMALCLAGVLILTMLTNNCLQFHRSIRMYHNPDQFTVPAAR